MTKLEQIKQIPRKTFVVVGPKGLDWVGLAENEADAWRVALGWPHEEEIADAKARGWYVAEATVSWKRP